jgi:hypothetical protein
VAHNHDERRAELPDAIFDRTHGRSVGHVAGIAGDEKFADADAAEQQFRRHPAIRAGQDHGPGQLPLGHVFTMLAQIVGADLRRGDVFFVAGFQPRQRFIGGDARCGARSEGAARAEPVGSRGAGRGQ